MSLKVAKRGAISPFIVMEVMRAAAEREAAGGDVLHLEVGQPSSGAPAAVIEAAKRALDGDRLGYTDALGIPPLRAAISRFYHDRYGIAVPERRVVVTTGSSAGFSAGVPRGVRAGRPGRHGGSQLSGVSQYPDGAWRDAGGNAGGAGVAVPADGRVAGKSRAPGRRPDHRQPVQSGRHHAGSGRVAAADGLLPAEGHPAGFRRDLPWHLL